MRISRVRATPVRLHVSHAPYVTDNAGTKVHWNGRRSRISPKRPVPMLEYVIVRVETDEGVVGIGEAQADIGFFGNTVEEVQSSVEDYLGPQLVGKDPLDREHLFKLIDFRSNSCAQAGIDLALHDLAGKALGAPVSVLLGGRHQTEVAVAIEIAGGPAEAMAAACVDLTAKGVRAFKAKIGGSPEEDAQRLVAIREAVGETVSLRADANQGYNAKEAIRLCRILEREGIALELLEQPVPAWDLKGMALVRSTVDTPIEADESCYTIHDALELVRRGAADVLNVKIGKAGGLYQAKKIMAIAEAAGLRCVLGTAFGLGPEVAAKLHLAASSEIVEDPVEFTELTLHGNLLVGQARDELALPVRNGCLRVPEAPGLGVELDEEALARAQLVLES